MKRSSRPSNKLTAKQVENSKPGLLGDGDGLWLKTRQRERGITRRFVFRYRRDGSYKEIPIGRFPDTDLVAARAKASIYRATLDDDRDPAMERREKKATAKIEAAKKDAAELAAALTWRQAVDGYVAAIGGQKWKAARTGALFLSMQRNYVYPTIGDLPVEALTDANVHAILDPVFRRSPAVGHRLIQRCAVVYKRAARRLKLTAPNPWSWKEALEGVYPDKPSSEHFKALPFAELPGLYARLSDMGDAPDALAARLQICLALRPSEARAATFAMIDKAAGTITWPTTKNGRPFTAPLNPAALAVIERCHAVRSSDYLFAGRDGVSPIGGRAIFALVSRLTNGLSAHATARSGFSDFMYETQPQIPESVVEAALNHAFGNRVTRSYKRGDQLALRREAMKIWSDYLLGVEPASNVVPFKLASAAAL
jgi:integrase